MLLSYDSHTFQSFHLFELLIQNMEISLSLISLDHQAVPYLHRLFYFIIYIHMCARTFSILCF